MVDRQLCDPKAAVLRQHRYEPMELAVEAHAVNDLRPVRLQPAVHVVQAQPGHPPRDPVEDSRQESPTEWVAAVRLPARNKVEPFVELDEQPRNLRRIVLEICVDRDDDLTAGQVEPRRQRRRLAEVSPEPDDPNVVVHRV